MKVYFDSPVQVHERDAQGRITSHLRDVLPGEPVEMDEAEALARIEAGNVKPSDPKAYEKALKAKDKAAAVETAVVEVTNPVTDIGIA